MVEGPKKMKAIPCRLRLHGSYNEHQVGPFPSITAAKEWANDCWPRPYTIVREKNITKN